MKRISFNLLSLTVCCLLLGPSTAAFADADSDSDSRSWKRSLRPSTGFKQSVAEAFTGC